MAAANLRAFAYNIQQKSRFDVKCKHFNVQYTACYEIQLSSYIAAVFCTYTYKYMYKIFK